MTLDALVEAILFAAARPLTLKQLAESAHADASIVQSALEALRVRLDAANGGVMLQIKDRVYELVTRPEARDEVAQVVQAETQGELTRPSLEALTILAYCGPMTRAELEQIRGVHSSLILRHLMLRGLVEQQEEGALGQPTYAVTFDFLNHLGIQGVAALPHYAEMRAHAARIPDARDAMTVPQPISV